jgi:hypothetical protein
VSVHKPRSDREQAVTFVHPGVRQTASPSNSLGGAAAAVHRDVHVVHVIGSR